MSTEPLPRPLPPDPDPPSSAAPPSPEPRPGRPAVLGKRRRFVVNGPSQLRMGIIVTAVALLLVVLLNLSLHSARSHATSAIAVEAPELRPVLEAQNRFELLLGITASLVFLSGIFVVTILETHKTAGAAYHLTRELERVRDGIYGVPVNLRKGDNLREIESALNEMTANLAERANLDVQELEHAASVADRVSSPPEASELALALRSMADERRRLMVGSPRG